MDWEKIAGLLHIADLSRKWPKLQHIHDAAMKELEAAKVEEKKLEERATVDWKNPSEGQPARRPLNG